MTHQEKITDLSYLREMSRGDSGIMEEMIQIFIEQVPEFRENISMRFESRDWYGLAAAAHKAKSSIRTMGMESMGNCLEQMEHLAKGNLKFELQIKREKGMALSPEDEKNWLNIRNETQNDIELKQIPELVESFLTKSCEAVDELKNTLKQLKPI